MASFQSALPIELALGVVGEVYDDAPVVAKPHIINSTSAAYNVVGSAFTLTAADPGDGSQTSIVQAGGTGLFGGLLANPKVYSSVGPNGIFSPLGASLYLPNYSIGEFVTRGNMAITVPGACSLGDLVTYNTTTGALGTVVPNFLGTGSISTTTLTVTAAPTGALGVGSLVTGPNVLPNTYITALGTGTGGNGTYTVNNSQTAASGSISAASLAPTGFAFVPNCKISRFSPVTAGVAVCALNN